VKRLLPLLLALLWIPSLMADGKDGGEEIYEILQKGFIKVAGKTNLFDFQGKAAHHEGRLVEKGKTYTGKILLRFSDLQFDLPMVDEVLERKDYMNTKVYPTISIDLDHFKPKSKPTQITAEMEMHGEKKPVQISTQFEYVPPVVKVTGKFTITQSEFGVKPYRKGLMKVGDQLAVEFKVFFCETYRDNKHQISDYDLKRLLAEEKIQVVNQKGFFGCAEIKNRAAK